LFRTSSIFNAADIAPKKKAVGRFGGRADDDEMSDF